jgi:hypothetical protein
LNNGRFLLLTTNFHTLQPFCKIFQPPRQGHQYKTYDLPAYNGGLFAPDEILDNITIAYEVLKNDALSFVI